MTFLCAVKVTFSDKAKTVAKNIGLVDPVIVQGMYIFKQPRVGTEGTYFNTRFSNGLYLLSLIAVTPHQDGSFLNNDPLNLIGFWFPLDDATLENGCLWYVPGSHSRPIYRRFVRNEETGSDEPLLKFVGGEYDEIADEKWVAAPVKKGLLNSLILTQKNLLKLAV